MYDSSYTSYTAFAEKYLFRYADRLLHDRVLGALSLSPTDEVLEIGCNQGHFLSKVRRECKRAIGVDRNAHSIAGAHDPDMRTMDATHLDFPDASFDKVVSLHTLEHVPDVVRALHEIARVLRPGGRAVIAYPLELVRGFSTLPSALATHHDPFMARRMHVHKLWPSKIAELLDSTSLTLSSSRLSFLPIPITPVYVSVLVKGESAAAAI